MPSRRTSTDNAGLPRTNVRGFTLIELLVVVAIFLLLAALGLLMSMDAFRGFLHRSERDTIVSILQKARAESMSNICEGGSCTDGKPHGVCYISPNYIVFQGTVCAANDPLNLYVPANTAATITGLTQANPVVFDQLTGKLNPQLTPATTEYVITVAEPGRSTITISINNEGTITW